MTGLFLSSPRRRGSIREVIPAFAGMTYFLYNLALLLAVSYVAFSLNPGRLFIGNDGPMLLALAREQLAFFGVSFDLHSNMQQGLGNLTFPINLSVMPGFWVFFSPVFTYSFFAALTFTSVLLAGWNYHIPRGISYAAAWLLTILLFPYFGNYLAIYAVTASSPCFVVYIFAAIVADIGIRRMGRHYAYMLLLLLGIFIMLAASPAALILIAPLLAVSFAVTFLHAARPERIRMLIAASCVVVLCLALGWVEYVAGLLLYSSSGFYMSELADSYSSSREFASILFQGHIIDRAFGPWLFILATLGAIFALYKKDPVLRIPAIITLAGQILHALIAAQLLAWSGGWTGPPPIYTEMTFFVLYAIFAVYFIASLLGRSYHPYCLPTLAGVLLIAIFSARTATPDRNLEQSFAMPPAASPVTNILAKKIPTIAGTAFGGRVATVLPATLHGQLMYSYRYNIALQNDHTSDGLWLFDIPTLGEYSQLVSPAFYRLTRDFLTLPNDHQNRSWTSFSYLDARIMRMLGARFILTTDANVEGASYQATLAIPNLRALNLLELADANTQGKGADTIIEAQGIDAIEDAMKKPTFDLHTAIVSTRPHTDARVTKSSIAYARGGYRITAESAGKAMLIVPVEYSHCLSITALSGAAPQAVRVNLALTGLVFDRKMDILMTQQIGPFTHPRCRMQDWREFRKLTGEKP